MVTKKDESDHPIMSMSGTKAAPTETMTPNRAQTKLSVLRYRVTQAWEREINCTAGGFDSFVQMSHATRPADIARHCLEPQLTQVRADYAFLQHLTRHRDAHV